MRRLCVGLVTMAALSLTANDAFAQNKYVALIGGATSSELRGGAINSDFKWGGTVGLQTGFRASYNTVVTVEASWVQMGGKFGDEETTLSYIEVPFMFGGVAPLGDSDWRVRLATGLGIGFKVGCSTDSATQCDFTNSPLVSWPIGLTFARWPRDGAVIGIDIRYSVGLGDAFKNAFANNYSWQFRVILGKQLF